MESDKGEVLSSVLDRRDFPLSLCGRSVGN